MKWAVRIFAVLYVIAAALLLLGTTGMFGVEKDPLSGVFLLPLGLPWNLLADRAGLPPVLAGLFGPAVNLGLLIVLERFTRNKRAGPRE